MFFLHLAPRTNAVFYFSPSSFRFLISLCWRGWGWINVDVNKAVWAGACAKIEVLVTVFHFVRVILHFLKAFSDQNDPQFWTLASENGNACSDLSWKASVNKKLHRQGNLIIKKILKSWTWPLFDQFCIHKSGKIIFFNENLFFFFLIHCLHFLPSFWEITFGCVRTPTPVTPVEPERPRGKKRAQDFEWRRVLRQRNGRCFPRVNERMKTWPTRF